MNPVLRVVDLGLREYAEALALQERLVARRKAGEASDTLLLVEHPPVYTLGRNADRGNILLGEEELRKRGIRVYATGRGGNVTYHGPGQLVGYPILKLPGDSHRVLWYVSNLEKVLVLVLADFGVKASTDPRNRGVWVGSEKIAALGVRVTRGVTMHGFALNVCASLENYGGIVPCGIRGKGVTSLHLLAAGAAMPLVKEKVVEKFATVFGYGQCAYGREDDAE